MTEAEAKQLADKALRLIKRCEAQTGRCYDETEETVAALMSQGHFLEAMRVGRAFMEMIDGVDDDPPAEI